MGFSCLWGEVGSNRQGLPCVHGSSLVSAMAVSYGKSPGSHGSVAGSLVQPLLFLLVWGLVPVLSWCMMPPSSIEASSLPSLELAKLFVHRSRWASSLNGISGILCPFFKLKGVTQQSEPLYVGRKETELCLHSPHPRRRENKGWGRVSGIHVAAWLRS